MHRERNITDRNRCSSKASNGLQKCLCDALPSVETLRRPSGVNESVFAVALGFRRGFDTTVLNNQRMYVTISDQQLLFDPSWPKALHRFYAWFGFSKVFWSALIQYINKCTFQSYCLGLSISFDTKHSIFELISIFITRNSE